MAFLDIVFGQNFENYNAIFPDQRLFGNESGILNLFDYEISDINQTKLRDYHRLDIRLTFKLNSTKSLHTLSLNLFNAYNNNNDSFIVGKASEDPVQYYIINGIGISPSIGYQYTFRQKTEILVEDF